MSASARYIESMNVRTVDGSAIMNVTGRPAAASTAALRAVGLRPTAIVGHSVGEIGAAEAAGILTLEQAVKVIFYRSKHQEATRGLGTMAVLLAPVEEAQAFLVDYPELDIAAYNSPKAVTVAGPVAVIDAAMKVPPSGPIGVEGDRGTAHLAGPARAEVVDGAALAETVGGAGQPLNGPHLVAQEQDGDAHQ